MKGCRRLQWLGRQGKGAGPRKVWILSFGQKHTCKARFSAVARSNHRHSENFIDVDVVAYLSK